MKYRQNAKIIREPDTNFITLTRKGQVGWYIEWDKWVVGDNDYPKRAGHKVAVYTIKHTVTCHEDIRCYDPCMQVDQCGALFQSLSHLTNGSIKACTLYHLYYKQLPAENYHHKYYKCTRISQIHILIERFHTVFTLAHMFNDAMFCSLQ